MAARGSWAEARNEKSIEKARAARDAERAKGRRARLNDLRARLGDGELEGETAKEIVRSIVEGDARRYNADKYAEIEREQDSLRAMVPKLSSERADIEGRYHHAVEQRDTHQVLEKERENEGQRTKVPTSEGSFAGVIGFALLLAVLEGVLLKAPFESIARTLFPSMSSVTGISVLAVTVIVLAGAVAVIATARELKRYHGKLAVYELAQARGGAGAKLVAKPSATQWQMLMLVAGVVQVLIFLARFQVETGDGATRNLFVLISTVVIALVPVVGFLEYRHAGVPPLPVSWDQETIDKYLVIDRRIGAEIPHADNVLESRKIDLMLDELHGYQSLASELGNAQVMRAIHELIDELRKDQVTLRARVMYRPPAATNARVTRLGVAEDPDDDPGQDQVA